MRTAWPVGSTDARPAGGLEHAELRLQLGGVAAEGVEGVANALRVEAVPASGDVLEARQATSATGLLPGLGLRLPSVRCLPVYA